MAADVIERFDLDDLPPPRRSDIRDRLDALDHADRAREARRRHRPHADLFWFALVLFAILALILWRSTP
jgi:hypothetical protein